ncbi:hypothetical protein [Deinococcus alpinitundrae]|nr:hypothetical protein [Deinococcus alpinitundrae]
MRLYPEGGLGRAGSRHGGDILGERTGSVLCGGTSDTFVFSAC